MKVCGIEIKGSEAILAVAESTDDGINHLVVETKKIALHDDDSSDHVKSFSELVNGFVRDNQLDCIIIKKRNKKGEFSGGPTTFKIEGVIQLVKGCNVMLLSAPSVAAERKRHDFNIPETLNKYQHEAFFTACAAIVRAK